MDLELSDKQVVVSFFDQQPQPAFWMIPVFTENLQITDFEYRYCNREFYTYTGLSPEKVLGNRLSSSPAVSEQATRKTLYEEILQVYQSGERMQAWLYNPDLEKYYSYTRNRVEGGVLTVLQDRTEEHAMMLQLETQKRLMDNILKQSSNGITVGKMIRDSSGKIIDIRTILASDAAVRFTGIPKDLYLSKTASQVDPHFVGSAYFNQCVVCMETGEPFLTQYYLDTIGRWLEVTVSRMDAEHQIYIFTDVTSVKESQIRSSQAAERLGAVFNASQSGMFIFAPVKNSENDVIDFRFVITNPSFAAYVGQTPEVLKGELGSTFFPGYMNNGVFDQYKKTYLTGETLRQHVHYHVDGHDLYLDLLSTKVQDEVLVTFTDYTESKKTQLQLQKAVEDLKHSNESLEEFAYAASHDLQEPLRKINTFSDRLKTDLWPQLNETQQRMFERIENATRRMRQLIDDLLDFSRVSRKKNELKPVDLQAIIALILQDLETGIQESGAVINVAALPVIRGDERQLQQLFQNLVGNALKYSKPGERPEIAVTARVVKGADVRPGLPAGAGEQPFHLVEVQDNGIGFAQEDAQRIFDVFTRLHGRSEYTGTGIGLSIARKVVESHNGYIWAESEPGKGSTFRVLFPVH
ncbi:hypothetical protein HRG84_19000 [Flavisolibacter sp. BT320]|nr:hypothetical protein [Flavisolibacter longurius]